MKRLYKSKWILPGSKIVIENGGLLVQNNLILNVLTRDAVEASDLSGIEIVELGNSVITPGFINFHTHLQYTDIGKKKSKRFSNRILRLFLKLKKFFAFGMKNNGFVQWIINLMIEYLCWTKEEKLESFKNGLEQVLRSGATCIAQLSGEEMYFDILKTSPVRAYVFFEVFANSEKSADESFKRFIQKYEKLSKKRDDSIFLGISPHSVYNVHKDLWRKIAEYSRQHNVLIHTHFAESREELKWIATGHSEITKLHKFVEVKPLKPDPAGLSPVSYLKELDLPWKNLTLAHLNQLEETDLQQLAELGTSIAHCPRSNMILHNKTIDIKTAQELFKNTIGIGTDSLYSNKDLNILNEARVVLDAGVDLFTLLDMLTINPAKALKIDHLIGALEKDKQADFLIFNLEENEVYSDFIKKQTPDYVYIAGKKVISA